MPGAVGQVVPADVGARVVGVGVDWPRIDKDATLVRIPSRLASIANGRQHRTGWPEISKAEKKEKSANKSGNSRKTPGPKWTTCPKSDALEFTIERTTPK